ncbi:MAG: radical SAM protein [Bacteroidales bacterium]
MNAYISYLNDLLNEHKLAYKAFSTLRWLNPYEAVEYQQQRDALMQNFKADALFKGTKPYLTNISPGCQLCGQGLWSCLFITGKCNANCFYCPSAQKEDDWPTSQGLTFKTPEAYAEYINYFGFQGASFSGGEPLLFKEKTMAYIRELRHSCSPDLYIWIYTNGILGNASIYKKLGQAGLNEIRFDIGATGFSIEKLRGAAGFIPNVTIEIPAVPEEKEKLKSMIPEIINAGVTRINLHQMRLTPYNAPQLEKRNYTFIAAERPIVMESELAALEIMEYAREKGFNIGINYCSFYFKYRFQKAGYRKILAQRLKPDAVLTECYYIRDKKKNQLMYENFLFADEGRLIMPPKKLKLKHKIYDYHKVTAHSTSINNNDLKNLINKPNPPENKHDFDIWKHECLEQGLRAY